MEFRSLGLDGPFEILPGKIEDSRGYFSETFRQSAFAQKVGAVEFVQENQSLSTAPGTIRGIHFQANPSAQGKLVRCIAGRVFDVSVDLRSDSATFGRWAAIELSPQTNNQLWIPVGFGHAFCTLEPDSIVSYRVTSYYDAQADMGVARDDPDIAIEWPRSADPATLSPKDLQEPALRDLPTYFTKAAGPCA